MSTPHGDRPRRSTPDPGALARSSVGSCPDCGAPAVYVALAEHAVCDRGHTFDPHDSRARIGAQRRATGTRRAAWATAVVLSLCGVAAELTLRAAAGLGLWRPSLPELGSYYVDDDPTVGVWRRPGTVHRHVSECFAVTYQTNSAGARDRERAREAAGPRALVLGDSFVEGYGVEQAVRVTDRLEAATGIEHVNLGVSGNFSHVQAALLYEREEARYQHSHVLLFSLPDNDWIEADPERFWQPWRYRPYLDADGTVYYPTTLDAASAAAARRRRLRELGGRLAVVGLGLQVEAAIRARRAGSGLAYDDFRDVDLARLLLAVERIQAAAGDRREVWLFTIPRLQELRRAASGATLRLPGVLGPELERRGVHYLDLTPAFLAAPPLAASFHTCDGHWNARGHQLAAEAVAAAVWGRPPAPAGEPPRREGRLGLL